MGTEPSPSRKHEAVPWCTLVSLAHLHTCIRDVTILKASFANASCTQALLVCAHLCTQPSVCYRGAPAGSAVLPPTRSKPAEWFNDYIKNMEVYGSLRPASAAAALHSRDKSSRYQRSNRNPGVGFDEKRKKFTLMIVEDGVDKPFGSFLVEEEGVQGFAGMADKKDIGPHGIPGVPRTNKRDGVARQVLHELNGPPGVQLQPAGYWQKNMGASLSAGIGNKNPNVGNWTTPQGRPVTESPNSPRLNNPKAVRPVSASLLAGRPLAARRQRPSTALLREKGQWTGQRPDHQQECPSTNFVERVEYNPDTMKHCWAGGWNPQRPPPGIPFI